MSADVVRIAGAAEGWDRVIARMEAEVAAAARSLDAGTPIGPLATVAPEGLGPLPPHLHERARLLHEDLLTIAEGVARAAAEVAGQLERLEADGHGRPAAMYVDSHC